MMFRSMLPIAWIWRKARPWESQNDRTLPHGDGYLGSASRSRRGPCRYGSCRAERKIVSVGGETKPDVCEEEDPPMAPFRTIRWKFCWIPGPATMRNGSGLKISSMSVSAQNSWRNLRESLRRELEEQKAHDKRVMDLIVERTAELKRALLEAAESNKH